MATLGSTGFITQIGQQSLVDDLPASSQSTLLLQKKKEMAEVQQQLDRKKDEFRQRMQRCQEKEVDLAAKQEAIKEQVRKFDKFLKDNDAKRVRANRKAQEEIKLRESKELEKKDLANELKKQEEKRNELQSELARKAVYEHYLEVVCDTTEYFEDIENVLKRYETLEAAHQDLRKRVEEATMQTEEQSKHLADFIKTSQTTTLVSNSEIASHQKMLDHLRLEAQDEEGELYRLGSDRKDRLRQLGEIEMAIQNIHLRALSARGPAPDSASEHSVLLDAVQHRILDLKSIAENVRFRESGATRP